MGVKLKFYKTKDDKPYFCVHSNSIMYDIDFPISFKQSKDSYVEAGQQMMNFLPIEYPRATKENPIQCQIVEPKKNPMQNPDRLEMVAIKNSLEQFIKINELPIKLTV